MPVGANLYFNGFRILRGLYTRLNRLWSGFWLGLLDDGDLEALDRLRYERDPLYRNPEHLAAGLWPWEDLILREYFPARGRLAVLGAGAGREYAALARRYDRVDAFEAQACLRDAGNRWLRDSAPALCIQPMPYNGVPEMSELYDGIVLGWGLLSGVGGRENRQTLLQACRTRCHPGGVVLASFLLRHDEDRSRGLSLALANALRRLRGKPPREIGDALDGGFLHRFSAEEIADAVKEAGFDVAALRESPYPHLLARARP